MLYPEYPMRFSFTVTHKGYSITIYLNYLCFYIRWFVFNIYLHVTCITGNASKIRIRSRNNNIQIIQVLSVFNY